MATEGIPVLVAVGVVFIPLLLARFLVRRCPPRTEQEAPEEVAPAEASSPRSVPF